MRVLVAADKSEHAVVAADVARRLFGDEAEYLLLSVAPMPRPNGFAAGWGAGISMTTPLGAGWADGALSTTSLESLEGTAELHAAAVGDHAAVERIEPMGDVGEPATCILSAAQARDVDLIVVGWHHRSWWSRLLVPSVSRAVVRSSRIPVLVVR